MKFEDIPAPRLSLRVRPSGVTTAFFSHAPDRRDVPVRAVLATNVRDRFDLAFENKTVTVSPVQRADANALCDVLSSGRVLLARLFDFAPDGSADLQLVQFGREPVEMDEIEVGLDETAVTSMGRLFRKNTLTEAGRYLDENCVYFSGEEHYFFLVAGAAEKEYLEKRNGGISRAFTVLGADVRFRVCETAKGDGEMFFLASGVTRNRNQREELALRLVRGNLKCVDWTAAGRSPLAAAQLKRLTEESSSYLRKWDEFGDAEGELFLKRARTVGAIACSELDSSRDATFSVVCAGATSTQIEALKTVSNLEITDDIPEYLNNLEMSFKEYAESIFSSKKASPSTVTLENVRFDDANYQLYFQAKTRPAGKWLIYSVIGEVKQIERRMDARKRILEGRSAIPHLGLLMEEKGQIPACGHIPKMKPLTAFVKNKVFKSTPTLMQERAIAAALNTPDIALIQGPPGTGKTTVIAAIVERLNEEAEKRQGIKGRILLSGFQHDAVENMISRVSLNGLPVPKFGKRRNEDADTSFERELQEWCNDKVHKLREKHPQITESTEERSIRNQCLQYICAPSLALAISLLDTAMRLPHRTLGQDLLNRLRATRTQLQEEQDNTLEGAFNQKLGTIRAIRVTEAGFGDDGPARAADILYTLKDDLEGADKLLLSQASNWRSEEAPNFLASLKNLKKRLLRRYTPAPVFRQEKTRDEVVNLIKEVLERIAAYGLSMTDKKIGALAELLLEMENNPSGILDAISEYSFAFAATCQQSVNHMMQKMKGTEGLLEYDYVIVDEAARVSPRDLMIPMAQGKRIILVGDHRQLPQLIDDEVAERLAAKEDGEGVDQNNWLKKSMFEYLFTERLNKLEEADGIQRCVTLDLQYRMHPVLGDFISRNFYEYFEVAEKFGSGLAEDTFAHSLPGIRGKCAVWLDVPQTEGGQRREGSSWIRDAEVRVISEHLQQWMHSAEGCDLSFGVIAFYKAQTERIRSHLGERFCEEAGARLRIGTVDSFQGMEFDVVFLSVVRTAGGFGFLEVYNRLNVSMSRQKKVLVAVGDAAYCGTPEAHKKVPGLANFLALCHSEHGVMP